VEVTKRNTDNIDACCSCRHENAANEGARFLLTLVCSPRTIMEDGLSNQTSKCTVRYVFVSSLDDSGIKLKTKALHESSVKIARYVLSE
jgi:hypothetical protein